MDNYCKTPLTDNNDETKTLGSPEVKLIPTNLNLKHSD
jgi:hypothetical protein